MIGFIVSHRREPTEMATGRWCLPTEITTDAVIAFCCVFLSFFKWTWLFYGSYSPIKKNSDTHTHMQNKHMTSTGRNQINIQENRQTGNKTEQRDGADMRSFASFVLHNVFTWTEGLAFAYVISLAWHMYIDWQRHATILRHSFAYIHIDLLHIVQLTRRIQYTAWYSCVK